MQNMLMAHRALLPFVHTPVKSICHKHVLHVFSSAISSRSPFSTLACHRIAQESVSFQPNILSELLQAHDLMPPLAHAVIAIKHFTCARPVIILAYLAPLCAYAYHFFIRQHYQPFDSGALGWLWWRVGNVPIVRACIIANIAQLAFITTNVFITLIMYQLRRNQ